MTNFWKGAIMGILFGALVATLCATAFYRHKFKRTIDTIEFLEKKVVLYEKQIKIVRGASKFFAKYLDDMTN